MCLSGFASPANLVAASAGKMRKTLHLYLVKPSQYDDDGYVVRHFRGVLPSNTLACLAGLTEDVVRQNRLGDSWKIKVHLFDETVDKIPVKRICHSQRWGFAKTIVCLVGVQTNQFPRACDLAHTFRRAGLTVLIGGFHVSGIITMMLDGVKDPSRGDIPATPGRRS